eukprot:753179-Hanusia_phi.AAC.2
MEVEADLCQVAVQPGNHIPAVMRIQSSRSAAEDVSDEVNRPMLQESDESSASIVGEWDKEEEGGLHAKYGSIYKLRQQGTGLQARVPNLDSEDRSAS